jgi:hypothetical protein
VFCESLKKVARILVMIVTSEAVQSHQSSVRS